MNIGNNQNYRRADMEAMITHFKGRAGELGAQSVSIGVKLNVDKLYIMQKEEQRYDDKVAKRYSIIEI